MKPDRSARDALVAAVAALPGPEDSAAAACRNVLARGRDDRERIELHLESDGWELPAAVCHLKWAPLGRTRLEAALIGVTDAMLDGRPFAGEWTIRQQLAHAELTYERYSIATLYASRRGDGWPLLPGPDAYPLRQGEPTGIPGETARDVITRLRRAWDDAVEPLLAIPEDRLQRPTEWHTAEHTVGFRLHRFGQHDLEMAVDVRRTAAALGVRPTPPLLAAAALLEDLGEREMLLLGVPEERLAGVRDLLERQPALDRLALATVKKSG